MYIAPKEEWDGKTWFDIGELLPSLNRAQRNFLVKNLPQEDVERFAARKIFNMNERALLELLDYRVPKTVEVAKYPVLQCFNWSGNCDFISEEMALALYERNWETRLPKDLLTEEELKFRDYLCEKLSYGFFMPA